MSRRINRPHTPFDYLLPSTTSDRYLGIEIDTRQLVVTDDNFKVTKRFDVTFEPDRRCDLFWSANERYAICRTCLPYSSTVCSAFRIDLRTGEKRPLGDVLDQQSLHLLRRWRRGLPNWHPSGRYRMETARRNLRHFIAHIPAGKATSRDVARDSHYRPVSTIGIDKSNGYAADPGNLCNSDCNCSQWHCPNEDKQRPGFHYHLIDRDGKDVAAGIPATYSQFISPYHLVAFANHDQTIVACDDSRLFSIPVEMIKKSSGAEK